MVRFTKHAQQKFAILRRHGFRVAKSAVVKTVEGPNLMDYARLPLKTAQRDFDKIHVLRVVYREENNDKVIITFYPGRKTKYGTKA